MNILCDSLWHYTEPPGGRLHFIKRVVDSHDDRLSGVASRKKSTCFSETGVVWVKNPVGWSPLTNCTPCFRVEWRSVRLMFLDQIKVSRDIPSDSEREPRWRRGEENEDGLGWRKERKGIHDCCSCEGLLGGRTIRGKASEGSLEFDTVNENS